MYTTDELEKRARLIHGDKYVYNWDTYTKMTQKMQIICPEHGAFWQSLHQHINKKQGCNKCGAEQRIGSRKDTTETFIEKAHKVHGDKYDYSEVEYVDTHTKICIICPEHGRFWQQPNCHLNGNGCNKCRKKTEVVRKFQKRLTQEDFLNKSNEKFGNKFKYDLTNYKNLSSQIRIYCEKHGWFEQCANTHLSSKTGCPKCSYELDSFRKYKTTEDFIRKAREVHGEKYDYTKVKYKDCESEVCIICPKHGEFFQKPYNHLSGYGCKKCGGFIGDSSKEEIDFCNFISSLTTNAITKNDREVLNGKEIDVLIPDKKVAFEYNGLYWHSEIKRKDRNYHIEKTEECNKKGVRLIQVFEDEWIEKQDICKSRIKNILGVTNNRIFARKCIIKEISSIEKQKFLKENHIQGDTKSNVNIGLFYNDELISVMTFSKLRRNLGHKITKDGQYELLRFCNKLDTSVIGGASKMLKYFINTYNPIEIISYADRRWSDGNLYEQLGFTLHHTSAPSYFYIIGDKRYNRFNFRKDILVSKYGCPIDMTEHEFCLAKKWYRIYDCGCYCYKLDVN